jgi:hypothetical protein
MAMDMKFIVVGFTGIVSRLFTMWSMIPELRNDTTLSVLINSVETLSDASSLPTRLVASTNSLARSAAASRSNCFSGKGRFFITEVCRILVLFIVLSLRGLCLSACAAFGKEKPLNRKRRFETKYYIIKTLIARAPSLIQGPFGATRTGPILRFKLCVWWKQK